MLVMLGSIVWLASATSLLAAETEPMVFGSPLTLQPHSIVSGASTLDYLREMDYRVALKYGVNVSSSLSSRLRKRATSAAAEGAAPLGSLNSDLAYYTTVALGNPPQLLSVIVDTGSIDLVVAGSPCYQGCNSQTRLYDPALSSMSRSHGEATEEGYLDGMKVKGEIWMDTMQMAGYEVMKQEFNVFHTHTPNANGFFALTTQYTSGILGLGMTPPSSTLVGLSKRYTVSFPERLFRQGILKSPVVGFGMKYTSRPPFHDNDTAVEPAPAPGGYMTIGGVNSTLFTGQINYLNVESLVEGLPFWAVQLDQINVDGKSSNIVSSIVIVDTGASLIYLSDESLRAVFAQIPGSRFIGNENEWILPCDSKSIVAFVLGGVSYSFTPQQFIIYEFAVERFGTNQCGSVFRSATSNSIPIQIIGLAFLKTVYSAFRFKPFSVGFAPLSSAISLVNQLPTLSNGTLHSSASSIAQPTTAVFNLFILCNVLTFLTMVASSMA